MQPRSPVLGFLWRFALVYGVLIAPWPGFNEAYGRYFRALGQMSFARENSRRILYFEAIPEALGHVLDTRIGLGNRDQFDRNGSGPVRYLELDTRGVGWIPTALIISLILATPVPLRRRIGAMLLGLFAIHVFILISVATYIWNNSADISLIVLSPWEKRITQGLEETLVTQLGAGFIVPVAVWILVTFRREDMIRWRPREALADNARRSRSDMLGG